MSQEEIDKLYDWACNEDEGGATRYAGMSYEDGIKAVIDVLNGEATVDELIG
jgi:hypothetical protein